MRSPLTQRLFLLWLIAIFLFAVPVFAKHKASSKKSRNSFSHKKSKSKHHLTAHRKSGHYLPVDPQSFEGENDTVIDPDTLGHIYYSKIFDMPVDTSANLKLFNKVENWIGAPYRLGGASHWGIDCSQFARTLYSSISNSFVGQTCRDIIGRVQKLSKIDLKPGDFVFFKIHGPTASHMGVYLGGNKFVHSSSSKGVMISDLNDPYYNKHFLVGGRAGDQTTAAREAMNSLVN